MRNGVPGRRTLFLMLALVVILIVFWQLSAQRFRKAPSASGTGGVADIGPQTLT